MVPDTASGPGWPIGGGEMARLIRDHDWSGTPLGPICGWSERLRAVVEQMLASPLVGSLAWGPSRVLIYNDAAAGLYGDRHPAALGRPLSESWPEAYASVAHLYDRAAGGEAVQVPAQPLDVTPAGGEVFDVTLIPVRDGAGAVAGVLMTGFEVGARLRAEAAVRDGEGRYRALFNAVNQGLAINQLVRDGDGRVVDARFLELNPAHEAQAWVSNATTVGRLASEVVPFLDRGWFEMAARVVETGQAERYESFAPGLERWFSFDMARFEGRDLFVVLSADITERKRAEAELRHRGEQFETLIHQAPIGVYLVDGDFRIAQVNPIAQPVLGDMPDIIGRDFDEVIHILWETSYADELCRLFRHTLETGEPYDTPERAEVRADRGLVEYYAWRIDRITLPNGQFGVVCYFSDISGQVRARLAIAESEAKHRTLFETMGQGYADVELLRDEDGLVVDHRLLVLNPAFERLVGVSALEATGRKGSEVLPGLEPSWLETYERVARRGEPERVECGIEVLGKWFELFAYPAGGDRLTLLFEEVTDRHRAQEALRASEKRQALLLKLGDALRPLVDPVAIQKAAVRLVGGHLGAARAHYVEVDEAAGTASIGQDWVRQGTASQVGSYQLADFGWASAVLHRDGSYAVPDTHDTPLIPPDELPAMDALDTRAGMGAGLIKDGRLVGALLVNEDKPRNWTGAERELLHEVAERTWAAVERARAEAALRATEAQLQGFGEASSDVVWIRDADTLDWTYLSPAFEAIYGLSRDEALTGETFRNWLELIIPEDRERARAMIMRTVAGERVTFEYRVRRPVDGTIRTLRNTDFPILDATGRVTAIGGVGHDATAEVAAKAAVNRAEHRLRTLMEGIPPLVWTAVDDGHWTWSSPHWSAFTGLSPEDSLGRGWLQALHPDDRDATLAVWAGAVEKGRFETEYRLRAAAEQDPETAWRWFQTSATPVRDDVGRIVEWLGTSTDVQDLKDMTARQGVLVAELQHRTRNLLGVVRSLAEQSLRSSRDLSDFAPRFRNRLAALARANGFLSRLDEGRRVAFDDLIRAELEALGDTGDTKGRVTLKGPRGVALRSAGVQTLALALHELATNAMKYGALSHPGGRLSVIWRTKLEAGRPWLLVDWHETGVVIPDTPAASPGGGAGRLLIEQALPYQLGARTTFALAPGGVRCHIALPVSDRTMA